MAEAQTEAPKKKKKMLIVIGKRKKAVARAFVHEGKGIIKINSTPIDLVQPNYAQMRLKEPVIIAGELAKRVDIDVRVSGGGVWGQTDASRTAIANALVQWTKDNKLKDMYTDYDRSLLVSDSRRTEPHKPSRSTAGPRRGKQQSKR
ncbi:MAG: 30S ribosomal protein S9 [Candidatus Aenigmarchaeota archaeon]|nr:30S ribosomal protein S9 [Candidatus Aenigmarchaeota archaeon]